MQGFFFRILVSAKLAMEFISCSLSCEQIKKFIYRFISFSSKHVDLSPECVISHSNLANISTAWKHLWRIYLKIWAYSPKSPFLRSLYRHCQQMLKISVQLLQDKSDHWFWIQFQENKWVGKGTALHWYQKIKDNRGFLKRTRRRACTKVLSLGSESYHFRRRCLS